MDEGELAWGWESQISQIREARRTWRRAQWTKSFGLAAFKALDAVCGGRKIRISGRIARALFVERELDEMEADIAKLRYRIRNRGSGLYAGIDGGGYGSDYDDYWY